MEVKILKIIRFMSAAAHVTGLAAIAAGEDTVFLLPLMSWSFLLFISSDNQIRESNSLFMGSLRGAGILLASSLFFGALLEAANFVLGHHYYVGAPAEIWMRWPLYFVSFAAMVPLILEIERKLENLGLADVLSWRKITVARSVHFFLLAAGLLLLIPLALSPLFFYPLFWIVLILLTEPVLHLLGHDQKSISGQFEEGYYGQAFRLIMAGIIFGFLWEFWNFRAGAKWFYTPAGSDGGYLFELPLLEFWGYAFTAFGAYAFYQLCLVLNEKLKRSMNPGPALTMVMISLFLFLAAVMAGMDALTIVSFRQVI